MAAEKKKASDPRQAYGAMQDQMNDVIRRFLNDLPGRHVYMTAKTEKAKDGATGHILQSPAMPGDKAPQGLPYFFDALLALIVRRTEDNQNQRALLCDTDGTWQAKDRSGRLSFWEAPDLGAVIKKMSGEAQ